MAKDTLGRGSSRILYPVEICILGLMAKNTLGRSFRSRNLYPGPHQAAYRLMTKDTLGRSFSSRNLYPGPHPDNPNTTCMRIQYPSSEYFLLDGVINRQASMNLRNVIQVSGF